MAEKKLKGENMSRTTKVTAIEEWQGGKAKEELLIVKTRKNPTARAHLAEAMLEDDAIRKASQANSYNYLNRIEVEKDRMPEWMWNVAWFILGMLTMISLDSLVWQLPIMVEKTQPLIK